MNGAQMTEQQTHTDPLFSSAQALKELHQRLTGINAVCQNEALREAFKASGAMLDDLLTQASDDFYAIRRKMPAEMRLNVDQRLELQGMETMCQTLLNTADPKVELTYSEIGNLNVA